MTGSNLFSDEERKKGMAPELYVDGFRDAVRLLEYVMKKRGFGHMSQQEMFDGIRLLRKVKIRAFYSSLSKRDGEIVKDMGGALRRIEAYKTQDFLTEDMKAQVLKAAQARRLELAAQKKKIQKLVTTTKLESIAAEAIKKMSDEQRSNRLGWLVEKVKDEWQVQHSKDEPPPSRNTITPVLKKLLPGHPKAQVKK